MQLFNNEIGKKHRADARRRQRKPPLFISCHKNAGKRTLGGVRYYYQVLEHDDEKKNIVRSKYCSFKILFVDVITYHCGSCRRAACAPYCRSDS